MNPTIPEVLADPAASYWLKDALRSALKRDPVDAANGRLAQGKLGKGFCPFRLCLRRKAAVPVSGRDGQIRIGQEIGSAGRGIAQRHLQRHAENCIQIHQP